MNVSHPAKASPVKRQKCNILNWMVQCNRTHPEQGRGEVPPRKLNYFCVHFIYKCLQKVMRRLQEF